MTGLCDLRSSSKPPLDVEKAVPGSKRFLSDHETIPIRWASEASWVSTTEDMEV